MNRLKFSWSRLAAASILAIGITLIWAMVVMWIGSIAAGLSQPSDRFYETVVVTMDGTPVIVSRSNVDYQSATYRTLDGEPLPSLREEWLAGASLPPPVKPPLLWETPIRWPERIAGVSDAQRPAKTWYLIRDDEPIGRAYLVGYDELSKLPVGYIGREGFRRSLPPKEEWFELGRRRFDWQSGAVTSSGNLLLGGRPGSAHLGATDQRLPVWHLFLFDGDRLLEIDLLNRSLRPIYESPDLVSVDGLLKLRRPDDNAVNGDADPQDANAAAPNTNNAALAGRSKTVTQIVMRTSEQIVVLDPPTGTKHEYVLPKHIRDEAIQAYAIGNDQLLVQTWNAQVPVRSEFIWLGDDGSVIRQQEVTTTNNLGSSERLAVVIGTLAFPVPIGYLFGLFVGIPMTLLQTNEVPTYPAALARSFEMGWIGLPTAIVLGVALTWWTYQLHRKYRRPATGVWCAFVLLFGWPAFLAYWIEHRRPQMETCDECGTVVPRDRDTCASCNSLFPAPPLVGTEIYA